MPTIPVDPARRAAAYAALDARLAQEAADRVRLIERYGGIHLKRLLDYDPNVIRPLDLIEHVLASAPTRREADDFDRPLPAVPVPDRADLLASLRVVGDARREADRAEHDVITEARTAGATWREIADALDLTTPKAP